MTRCNLLIMIYSGRMCQCWLQAVACLHIGTLMRFLTAEPRSTTGLLFPCQYLCGSFLLTLYSMMWDWRVLRRRTVHFYCPKVLAHFRLLLFYLSLLFFDRLVLLGMGLRTDHSLPVLHCHPHLTIIMINYKVISDVCGIF